MRLRHIEVFHTIMSTGSIASAARLLNVSQPAVTKVLQHAESQLGFRLFDRVKGRLVPTREGRSLFAETEKLFACLDQVRTLAANLKGGGPGVLRIAAPPALCLEILPAAVARFRERHPEVQFSIVTHHHAETVNAVLTQAVDLGIAFSAQPHPGVEVGRLATAEFVGVFPHPPPAPAPTPAPTPAGDGAAVPLDAFADHPFIGLSRDDPVAASVYTAIMARGLAIEPAVEVKTYSIALSLVRANAGAAVVDQYTAASAGEGMHIRRLDPSLSFDVSLISPKYAPPDQLARQFIGLLTGIERSRSKSFFERIGGKPPADMPAARTRASS